MKQIGVYKVLESDLNIYTLDGERFFSASEVGEILEYSKANISKMVKNVDDDEKILKFVGRNNSMSNDTRKKEQWFLTRDGLHELLFQSRKPIAKEFKKEVKRILNNIADNGYYIATEKDDKWIGVRNDTKIVRREETDTIKEFVELAKQQGSSKPQWYYKHFTNLVRGKLGIPEDLKRDDMSQDLLRKIQSLETLISMKLNNLILTDKHYKDIYKIVKNMINDI